MRRLSRRTFIAGAGSGAAVGLAGCLFDDSSTLEDEPSGDSSQPGEQRDERVPDRAWPETLQTGLSYAFPAKEHASFLSISRADEVERAFIDPGRLPLANESRLEWTLRLQRVDPNDESVVSRQPGLILSGSPTIDQEEELQVSGTDRGFDRYKQTNADEEWFTHLASNGEVLLAGQKSFIDRTLQRHHDGAETVLESESGVVELLEAFEFTGYNVRLTSGQSFIKSQFEEVRFTTVPEALGFGIRRTDETELVSVGAVYPEPVGDTERTEFVEMVEGSFTVSDGETEAVGDGRVLVHRKTEPYLPPEERPELPDFPAFSGYDEASEQVLFEFEEGESLPRENFELQIEGERYDGDWAQGAEEIGDGTVIAIDESAISPHDSMTLSYSQQNYSSSESQTVLRRLPVRFSYDPTSGQTTVEYVEGPPLAADRVTIRVGGDRTVAPWSGELSAGDTATIDETDIEMRVQVTYERTDGRVVEIAHGLIEPPAVFALDYDGSRETLSVTYPENTEGTDDLAGDRRPVESAAYEIRVNGEPTETQLTAAGEQFEPGETVEVTDVPTGVSAEVVRVAEDNEYTMARISKTTPNVSFEMEFEDETVTVTHAGGPTVQADRLTVEVLGEGSKTVDWTGTGTVSEGTELAIDDINSLDVVLVRYMGELVAELRQESREADD